MQPSSNVLTFMRSAISLAQLQKELDKAEILFSRYGINLTYLNYQASTIEVNLQNYGSRLRLKMEEKIEAQKMPADLKLLEQFRCSAQEKYLGQVQKDSENLTAGLKLLETAVNLIPTEVEVDLQPVIAAFKRSSEFMGLPLLPAQSWPVFPVNLRLLQAKKVLKWLVNSQPVFFSPNGVFRTNTYR